MAEWSGPDSPHPQSPRCLLSGPFQTRPTPRGAQDSPAAYYQHDHQLVLLGHLRVGEDAVQHLGHVRLELLPEVYHALVVVSWGGEGGLGLRRGSSPAPPQVCHQCHQWGSVSCLVGNDARRAGIFAGDPAPPPSCSRGSHCGTWGEAARSPSPRFLEHPAMVFTVLKRGRWSHSTGRLCLLMLRPARMRRQHLGMGLQAELLSNQRPRWVSPGIEPQDGTCAPPREGKNPSRVGC